MEYAELLYRNAKPEFEHLYQLVRNGKDTYMTGRLTILYNIFPKFKLAYEEKVIGEHAYCNLLRQYRELIRMDKREQLHPIVKEINEAILNHLPNNVASS